MYMVQSLSKNTARVCPVMTNANSMPGGH